MMTCALIYAFAVSISQNVRALLIASIMPVFLLFTHRISLSPLLKINAVNALVILTLALTWPVMHEGAVMGLLIAWRVNMIYIIFAALVFPLGMSAVYGLPLSEKLRVLLILTLRGINILHDSIDKAFISAGLRAPNAGIFMRLKIFAYVLGSSLLRSADRSERMFIAVQTRGGFGGFMQCGKSRAGMKESVMLLVCVSYSALVVMMNYA